MTKVQRLELYLFLLNQGLWFSAVQILRADQRAGWKKHKMLNDFAHLLLNKIEHMAPQIMEDPEIVKFLYDTKFEQIIEKEF